MGGYKALDIAKETVRLSIDNGLWLTNLKLQKVLYYIWRDYYEKTGKRLFEDDHFQAWMYGPVVPSVYYEYWTNVASKIFITDNPKEKIDKEISDFLLEELKKYRSKSASELVNLTHADGTPWSVCHKKGDKTVIPFELIEATVCRSAT